jgi:predicted porin
LGRQYTPVFNTGAATSPGQYNNVMGDVVYSGATSTYFSGSSLGSGNNNGIGFTNRASNAFTAQSDNFKGFVVGGMYAMNNQNQTQTGNLSSQGNGGNTNWGGWGLNGSFTWQKLYLGVAYQSFKTKYSNAIDPTTGNLNLGGNSITSGARIDSNGVLANPNQTSDKQTLVGGTYDFGILKAYAQWVGRKIQNDTGLSAAQLTAAGSTATSAVVSGEQLNRTAQQIGVRSYITPTIESWASIGTGKIKASAGTSSMNFVGWQLGSNYYLSKRTNLYAIYGQANTSSASNSTGATTTGSGSGANQYAVGVRHTF